MKALQARHADTPNLGKKESIPNGNGTARTQMVLPPSKTKEKGVDAGKAGNDGLKDYVWRAAEILIAISIYADLHY